MLIASLGLEIYISQVYADLPGIILKTMAITKLFHEIAGVKLRRCADIIHTPLHMANPPHYMH